MRRTREVESEHSIYHIVIVTVPNRRAKRRVAQNALRQSITLATP